MLEIVRIRAGTAPRGGEGYGNVPRSVARRENGNGVDVGIESPTSTPFRLPRSSRDARRATLPSSVWSSGRAHPRRSYRDADAVPAPASYTFLPPTHVLSTRVFRISSAGARMMSWSSTTKSAYLPGVSEPRTSSWKAA